MGNTQALFVLLIAIGCCCSCSSPKVPSTQTQTTALASDSSAQISDYIVSAFEDDKGNLWFGTMSDGVARYDADAPVGTSGKSLTYISTDNGLVNNTVTSVIQDTAGNYWFGTHAGASRFDGRVYQSFGAKEGLHGGACKFLVDKTGTLWAATYDGVFRFTGNSFAEFVLPNPEVDAVVYNISVGAVWRIIQDSKGNIWFGRDSYGACKYDGTTFTHYTKKDGLCSNNVSRIEEDKQGNIWFGCLGSDFPVATNDGGVCRLDADGSKIIQFPETPGLAHNSIYGIFCDKSGNVWISAGGVGVYRYVNNTFTLFKDTDRPDLIQKFYVQSFLEDSKGNLWFGFSGGLFRLNGSSFVNVTRGGIFN